MSSDFVQWEQELYDTPLIGDLIIDHELEFAFNDRQRKRWIEGEG